MKKNIFIPLLLISSFVFAQNTDEILIKDNQVWKDEYNRLKMIYVTKTGSLTFPEGSKCTVPISSEGQIIANGTAKTHAQRWLWKLLICSIFALPFAVAYFFTKNKK